MDPFGTTPLPTVLDIGTDGFPSSSSIPRVNIDVDALIGGSSDGPNGAAGKIRQQPQTQQVAVYEASPNTVLSGNLLDVNPHFYVYRVKNGLIRVLHRSSSSRLLLRGHLGQQVTDIRFFLDGDVLGTVGSNLKGADDSGESDGKANRLDSPPPSSSIIIWRIFEHSPELNSEKLLEISTPHLYITNLIWHPFNPNQFFMLHSSVGTGDDDDDTVVATLVESTRIQTTPHPTESHALCQFHDNTVLTNGAVQLRAPSRSSITAMEWSSRDPRHVLTVHDDGKILLWDLNQAANHDTARAPAAVTVPRILHAIDTSVASHHAEPLSHCVFLPHEGTIHQQLPPMSTTLTPCFATASKENSTITLWGSFAVDNKTSQIIPSKRLQIIQLQTAHPTSYLLSVGFGPASVPPPSCFLLAADRLSGRILACHIKSEWSTSKNGYGDANGDTSRKALAIGCDYVVPFVSKHAMYGWCVRCGPASEDNTVAENDTNAAAAFDMRLFSYQSKAIQCLTLTHSMCLPPSRTWQNSNDNIDKIVQLDIEELGGSTPVPSATVSTEGSNDMLGADSADYEDYDLDDDEDGAEDEGEIHAPDPSSLPTFDDDLGFGNDDAANEPMSFPNIAGNNAFANWLGAIAAAPSPAPDTAPPPGLGPTEQPLMAETPVEANSQPSRLLSPNDFLNTNESTETAAQSATPIPVPTPSQAPAPPPVSAKKNRSRSKSPRQQKNQGRSKSPKSKGKSNKSGGNNNNKTPKSPFPTGPVSILKREDKDPTVAIPSAASANGANGAAAQIDMAELETVFKKVLVAHHDAMNKFIPKKDDTPSAASAMQSAVKREVKSVIIPAITKVVQESLSSSIIRPLQQSVDNLSQSRAEINPDDLATALDEVIQGQLNATLAQAMRNVVIPALESTTGQMVQQVVENLPPPPATPNPTEEKIDSLSSQVSLLSDIIGQLTTQVKSLEATIAQQQATMAAQQQQFLQQRQQQKNGPPGMSSNGGPSGPEQMLMAIRRDVVVLLDQHNYEAAFTKALSASTTDMVVFCCSKADVKHVLGGHQPALSQPILLCLMQQLGAVVSTSAPTDLVTTELEWLQEIALVLQPHDPSIQRHVAAVLQQLSTSIENKLRQGNVNVRRPLQILAQVVRGLQQPQRYT